MPDMSDSVVIVGGGIAGQAVCEAVRDRDADVAITLICGESSPPYDRVRLSEILVSGEDPETLQLRPAEWYADNGVDLLLGTWVKSVDTAAKLVQLSDGDEIEYGRLVLATGSQPLMPPIAGIDLPGVHPFRGPEDCEAIRSAAAGGAQHAAVIGGGLLGLEAARGIAAQGCAVTVVHLLDRLMERQLDAGSAALLAPALADLDIAIEFERNTTWIMGDEQAIGLRFKDGHELHADLVVVSVGIRPEAIARARDGRRLRARHRRRRRDAHEPARMCGPSANARSTAASSTGSSRRSTTRRASPPRRSPVATPHISDRCRARSSRSPASTSSAPARRRASTRPSSPTPPPASTASSRPATAASSGRSCSATRAATRRSSRRSAPASPSTTRCRRSPTRRSPVPPTCPTRPRSATATASARARLIAAVIDGGCATPREVMAVTRAGTGCGSCRAAVVEIVGVATGGLSDEPTYLCPCRKQTREELAGRIRADGMQSVSEVAAACGTGRQCGVCKPALAYLVSEVNANRHQEERDARFINDRVHANIQKDGTFSVVPRMYGGVTTPDELRRIADVADKYEVPLVKVTGGQRLDLLGVRKQDLPAIWADLGMPSGHAYAKAVRTVKTCVGTDFCRFGLGDAIGLGIEMEKLWEGLHTPHKVKSGVSGCPRNCAEATIKDIGCVAVEGGWQVRAGGAAGGNVREADILATVATRAEALRVATTFLQFYRENADYKERTYDFIPRIGLEKVREIVLDEQIGAELRERLRIAKAAVKDPWLERDDPYHPKQFSDLDEPGLGEGEPALVGPPAGGER